MRSKRKNMTKQPKFNWHPFWLANSTIHPLEYLLSADAIFRFKESLVTIGCCDNDI